MPQTADKVIVAVREMLTFVEDQLESLGLPFEYSGSFRGGPSLSQRVKWLEQFEQVKSIVAACLANDEKIQPRPIDKADTVVSSPKSDFNSTAAARIS